MNTSLEFNWPLIGQHKARNFLQQSISHNKLSHFYIFYGQAGIGKFFTAKLLVKTLICESYRKYTENLAQGEALKVPCGHCNNCHQFEKNLHPDVFYVSREKKEEAESDDELKQNISVGQIRELQKKISKRSFFNTYKAVIINGADFLSEEAGNSLLKTLEEPAAKTIIILISSQKENLLPTILSRSQAIKFLPVQTGEIYNHLLVKQLDREKARNIARLSLGSPGQAEQYLQNPEMLENKINLLLELKKLLQVGIGERIQIIQSLLGKCRNKQEQMNLVQLLDLYLRELLMHSLSLPNLRVFHFLDAPKGLSSLQREKIVELYESLSLVKKYTHSNVNLRVLMENFVIKI